MATICHRRRNPLSGKAATTVLNVRGHLAGANRDPNSFPKSATWGFTWMGS